MRTGLVVLLLCALACGDDSASDAGAVDVAESDVAADSESPDAATLDAGEDVDAGGPDVAAASDAAGERDASADMSFVDEFDGDALEGWMRRHEVEGVEPQYTRLDLSGGALVLVPTRTPGWFADGDAPLIFRNVRGDFLAETEVTAAGVAGAVPGFDFNSAGLMARNASGAEGPENYIMVNVGRQDERIEGRIGSETKTTTNSSSVLTLQAGEHQGRLRLCRVGGAFLTLVRYAGEDGWTEIGRNMRADLPAELQVGMVANGFSGPDISARFEYFRLRVPSSTEDCAAD